MNKELKWFSIFPKALKKFRGKHIALIGEKVVAAGSSAKEVWERAKHKYPKSSPVLTYVPQKEALVLWQKRK